MTLTETLSRVMTSCGGTSRTTVRSGMVTIRSSGQKRKMRPGPFGSASTRPRRKTTPRSYSLRTLIHSRRSEIPKTTTIRMTANCWGISCFLSFGRTLRRNPSTLTTCTASSVRTGASESAFQISPCTKTLPEGSRSSIARPISPTRPDLPVEHRRALGTGGEHGEESDHQRRRDRRSWRRDPGSERNAGSRSRNSNSEPSTSAMIPPTASRP